MLSDEEKEREKKLNKALKPFGLSLDDTIQDVHALSKNPIKGQKAVPAKLISSGGKPKTLEQYMKDVKSNILLYDPEKTMAKLLSHVTKYQTCYDSITSTAYEKAEENPRLHSFELLFENNPSLPINEHIGNCLASIAYGIKVAHLITEIKNEANGTKTAKNKKTKTDGNNEGSYSVLEWATIFFYADTTKLLSNDRTIKTRMEKFMNKHKINTSFANFKNSYGEAKKRINDIMDYPIKKLELIIPFLNENYPQAVAKVGNDITFLKEPPPDY